MVYLMTLYFIPAISQPVLITAGFLAIFREDLIRKKLSMKDIKAPGNDGFTWEFLKILLDYIVKPLAGYYI